MLNINVPDSILDVFKSLIEEEGDDYCVRIREYKMGAG